MALADITINDGQSTPAAHVFAYIGTENGRVVRADLSAGLEQALKLTIGHRVTKSGGNPVDSHLWRIDKTILDADGITPYTPNIRISSDIPRRVYTDALADDLAAFVRNFATADNIRLLLKGSVF